MKLREKKRDDHEKTEEAYQLLLLLIKKHQKRIDPALWTGAMLAALSDNYEKSDIPFELFKEEIMNAVEHYKY